ncbi:MAG TPA: hypothetical protein VII32_04515 [Thermoanaerobaculia bacterium]
MHQRYLSGALIVISSLLIGSQSNLIAATPGSATISPAASSPVTWNGNALGGSSPDGESTCVEGLTCETFNLTLSGAPADWIGKVVKVRLGWLAPANDYDLVVHKDSVDGPEVASSANGATTAEAATLDPATNGTGLFVIHVVYFAATAADQYQGTVSVVNGSADVPPVSTAAPPTYSNFAAPAPMGQDAGEPSIGVNWKTNRAFFLAGLQTLRVTFDDSTSPATATWIDRSALNTSALSFDPILFTDSGTGRTFVSQLLPTKISLTSYTDDDGERWTSSQGAGIGSGVDHQTIGGGPFKPGVAGRGPLPTSTYPNAVYYASQDIALAEIALSQDGGLTFGAAVPMYELTQCGGLHGHIKVAPNGTVYVPNKSCGGHQAVAVSADNGLTWNVRPVPNSTSGSTDPSVGIGSDGTVYFAYSNGDGHARVAISRDEGNTWSDDQDLGYVSGIKNSVFPAAVAGDGDRASVFFVGSTTGGANGIGIDMAFDGTWYGYVATTYDRGHSWTTVQATGDDPVQRGVICTSGTTCASGTRNLLDFNDLQMDNRGRALAAFADGCVSDACRRGADRSGPNSTPDGKVDSYDNDGKAVATIIRQASGRTLKASYDPPNAVESLIATAGKQNGTRFASLRWNDVANEAQYLLERSTSAMSGFTQIAILAANTTSYVDWNVNSRTTYYYRLRATNSNGASPYSNTAKATIK